jgi:meso-butanediol dehydrogenase / (S,S)-butanediol dehydrogenase / diacetyl reductase
MTQRFKNKTALITGGGGGMGLAIVEGFAKEGAAIVAVDMSEAGLEIAKRVVAPYGASFHALAGNLSNGQFCDLLPSQAFELTGRLDIVINNAGIITRGNILESSDDDWSTTMQINVEAIFRICRAAIGIMKVGNGGVIVNTASCWGLYPGPNHVVYCTSKAAVAMMTQCLGRDHAKDNIRVNAVCPNEVNTPMLRSGLAYRGFDPDEAIKELNKTVPIGHIAEPEEIADVILFLASEEARYITGTTLEVNGGKPVY